MRSVGASPTAEGTSKVVGRREGPAPKRRQRFTDPKK